MLDQTLRIRDLIKRHHTGSLTAAEAEELQTWRNESAEHEAKFIELTDAYAVRRKLQARYKSTHQPAETPVYYLDGRSLPGKLARLRWLKKAVAVAAVLILVAGAVYLWNPFDKQGEKNIATNSTPEKPLIDKLPGHNNARLILSDGRVVDLDKTKPGLIAAQGNSSVKKTEDGKLVYETGKRSFRVAINTLETPAGGQYPLVLSDGTKIFLNSVSRLDFPEQFAADKRVVHFSGEGYFEVAKDSLRPFFVIINGQEIRVTGTKFVVSAYTDERFTMTTLVEGGIKVSNAPKDRFAAAVSLSINPKSITVTPGQALINDSIKGFTLDKQADVEAATAFTKGQFVLNSAPVSTALRQFARWYNVEVVYDNQRSFDDVIISAAFDKNQNLSEVMKILKALGVHTKLEGNRLIVTK